MLVKAGVDISRLRPQIRKKLSVIARLLLSIDKQELIITSTYEGDHSPGSLHYADLAVDFRIGSNGGETVCQLRDLLGKDYDIVLYETFIRVEYDPK